MAVYRWEEISVLRSCSFTEKEVAKKIGAPISYIHEETRTTLAVGRRISPQNYCYLREKFGLTRVKKVAHPDYPEHFATKEGQILFKDRELKQGPDGTGYLQVSVYGIATRVAPFVCCCFYGRRKSFQHVRHLDGNNLNNAVSNLKWGTPQENSDDRIKHGMASKVLTKKDIVEIRKLLDVGTLKGVEIAKRFGISKQMVSSIKFKQSWRWVK